MSKKIPQELIEFYPPDYVLEGSEVLEMIKYMPEKMNMSISRKTSESEVIYAEMRAKKHPERQVYPLEKEVIEVLYYAVQEIYRIFELRSNIKKHKKKKSVKVNYSILKYDIGLFLHTDYDIANVSFSPKIENWLEGPVYDLGVSFYFSLSSHELLETYYMR